MDLQARVALLESVLGEMEVALYSVTADLASVVHINPAAEALFGRRADEFRRNPRLWQDAIDAGEAAFIGDPVAEALARGHAMHIYRIVRPDGERRWVLDQTRRIDDSAGRPRRLDCILTDITRRMTVEQGLRALPERIMSAQERERRGLARELHDGVIQDLATLKLRLSELGSAPADQGPRLIDALNRHLDGVIAGLRRLAMSLRPSVLDDLGLVPALRSHVTQKSDESGVEAFVAVDLPDTRLSPELEVACFRIVQEALANALAHAGARRVFVSVGRAGGDVVLSVRDDGRGFALDAQRRAAVAGGHFGLAVMEERAVCIGGRLEIETSPGAGTEVIARLPYRPRSEGA